MRYVSGKKRYEEKPAKFEAMKQVSALIPLFESNVLFALEARGLTPKEFKKWMRRSGIQSYRYLFRPRPAEYYPIINLSDWQAISNYLRIPLKRLIYEDLKQKWQETAALTKDEKIKRIASTPAGSDKYKNRLDI